MLTEGVGSRSGQEATDKSHSDSQEQISNDEIFKTTVRMNELPSVYLIE